MKHTHPQWFEDGVFFRGISEEDGREVPGNEVVLALAEFLVDEGVRWPVPLKRILSAGVDDSERLAILLSLDLDSDTPSAWLVTSTRVRDAIFRLGRHSVDAWGSAVHKEWMEERDFVRKPRLQRLMFRIEALRQQLIMDEDSIKEEE